MKYAQKSHVFLDQPDFRQVFLLEQEAELQVNLFRNGSYQIFHIFYDHVILR